ncbi:MAG: PQQ-binding-like beta-propeller repeat protein [Phycisphaerae bacterium]|nr:PQQ-binding-like beta-propeller repeat protein [Phycisphaerae bacterium]
MSPAFGRLIAPIVVVAVAAVVLAVWLSGVPQMALRSGMAEVPMYFPAGLPGTLERGPGTPGDAADDWGGFRGPGRDGIRPPGPPLADRWGAGGPPVVWEVSVGDGYGGPAVVDGRVYLLDYDADAEADVLRCLSLATGDDVWRRGYPLTLPSDHGYSRTVPAATREYVVSFSPACHVLCTDTDGDYLWSIDLVKEYGATVPKWYAGQCPLIDRDADGREYAVIAPAGEKLMIAAWCAFGTPRDDGTRRPALKWTAENPHGWKMTHASPVPVTFRGADKTWRMYVYPASGGVVGVSREDGHVLWTYAPWEVTPANIPSPVDCGAGRILLTGGYGAGGVLLQLRENGGGLTAERIQRFEPGQLGSYQQTPIFHGGADDGRVYLVLPAGGGPLRGQLACATLSGEHLWTSGRADRFAWGPYVIADGKLLVMNNVGELTMARASPDGYRRLAQARVFEAGRESWAPMAVAGDKLLLRDFTRLKCLDLSPQDEP